MRKIKTKIYFTKIVLVLFVSLALFLTLSFYDPFYDHTTLAATAGSISIGYDWNNNLGISQTTYINLDLAECSIGDWGDPSKNTYVKGALSSPPSVGCIVTITGDPYSPGETPDADITINVTGGSYFNVVSSPASFKLSNVANGSVTPTLTLSWTNLSIGVGLYNSESTNIQMDVMDPVTGVGASQVASQTIALNVVDGFQLNLAPSIQDLEQRTSSLNSIQYNLVAAYYSSYEGTGVNLTWDTSNLPPGVSFQGLPLTIGGSGTYTIVMTIQSQNTGTVPLGTYNFSVTGVGNGNNQSSSQSSVNIVQGQAGFSCEQYVSVYAQEGDPNASGTAWLWFDSSNPSEHVDWQVTPVTSWISATPTTGTNMPAGGTDFTSYLISLNDPLINGQPGTYVGYVDNWANYTGSGNRPPGVPCRSTVTLYVSPSGSSSPTPSPQPGTCNLTSSVSGNTANFSVAETGLDSHNSHRVRYQAGSAWNTLSGSHPVSVPSYTYPGIGSYTATFEARNCIFGTCGTVASCSNTVTIVTPPPDTLAIGLAAQPSSGNSPLRSTLTGTVSGTATGTINYSFWWNCSYSGTSVATAISQCGDPDGTAGNTNGTKWDAVSTNPLSVLHTYSTGSYTAKVIAERGSAPPAESRASIIVSASGANNSPSVSNVNVSQTCIINPGAVVYWDYSDNDGDDQAGYTVQINDIGSSWDPPLEVDCTCNNGSWTANAACPYKGSCNSIATSFDSGSVLPLSNVTYKARVKVYDARGGVSSWSQSGNFTTPNECGDKQGNLDCKFTWNPATGKIGDSFNFFDFSAGKDPIVGWSWEFQSEETPTSNLQNPTGIRFFSVGFKNNSLTVTDSKGRTCDVSQSMYVSSVIPKWKEINPADTGAAILRALHRIFLEPIVR